jgi:hypothetical protein
MRKPILDYIIETFRSDKSPTAILAECIASARLNETEEKEVLNEIGSRK